MNGERQHSKYELCDRHAPWFAGETRYRILECMVEGGPGGWSPGCDGGRCRLWPGRDVFEASVCSGELELEWTQAEESVEDEDELESTCEARGLRHGQARYLVRKIQRGRVREAYAIRCPDDTFAVYSYEAPTAVRL